MVTTCLATLGRGDPPKGDPPSQGQGRGAAAAAGTPELRRRGIAELGRAVPMFTDTIVRLDEAAVVLRLLGQRGCRPAGHRAFWPDVVRSSWEQFNADAPERTRCPPARPGPAEISRMDEALSWMFWLDAADRAIVWGRALDVRWPWLATRLGISRRTVIHRYTEAVLAIALRRLAQDCVAFDARIRL